MAAAKRMLKMPDKDNMNPIDAWYDADIGIQQFFQSYYEREIKNEVFNNWLRDDLTEMFLKGNVTDKTMALTVLAAAKQYFH